MDREKVIEEAEAFIKHLAPDDKHKRHIGIMVNLGWIYDALAILKEQEAVKPKKSDNPEESEYCCGVCGYPLWLDELYCAHCGRRIEWEGR